MKTNIQIFKNEIFGEVRTMTNEKGETFFVGKDVATALGYSQADKAVMRHTDEDDRMKRTVIDNLGRGQKMYVINESGLYALILSSKLEQARLFKRWVTTEVLPAIRKTGRYELTPKELKVLGQKADYCDQVLLSVSCHTMTQVAKELGMSVYDLTRLLLQRGIIYYQGGNYMLYADFARRGYAKTRTDWTVGRDHRTHTTVRLVWTEEGRKFLHGLCEMEKEMERELDMIEFC